MQDRLSDIKEQLRSEEADLLQLIERLNSELVSRKQEVGRIQAALRELEGEKKKQPAKKRVRKPAASKAQVRDVVVTLLQEHGVIEDKALMKLVENAVTDFGKSRMGLALRLKEVLGEERFVDTPAGYRLAEQESAPSSATTRSNSASLA